MTLVFIESAFDRYSLVVGTGVYIINIACTAFLQFQFNLDNPHKTAGRQVSVIRDSADVKAIRTQFTSAFTATKLKTVSNHFSS